MAQTLLLVGTRKGLWIGRSDEARTDWSWDGPHFVMDEVYSTLIDTRGERPRLLVGAMSSHFGPQVFRSDDLGKTWEETSNGAIRFPEDTGVALEQVWQLMPGCPGTRPTKGSRPLFCRRASSSPSSVSAFTRSPGTPNFPTASSRRTTKACTGPTTVPARGPQSRKDCRPASGSRWWFTRPSRRRSTSSRSTAPRRCLLY